MLVVKQEVQMKELQATQDSEFKSGIGCNLVSSKSNICFHFKIQIKILFLRENSFQALIHEFNIKGVPDLNGKPKWGDSINLTVMKKKKLEK